MSRSHHRVVALGIVLSVLVATGCTGGSLSSSPSAQSPSISTSAAVARTSAVPVGSDQTTVSVAPAELTQAARSGLEEGWGPLALAAGQPVEISADGELPEGGVQLTRTYAKALTGQQAATWAFFDEELGSWRAVPSTVSADRWSVTAVVHHLSLWTDFVGWVGDTASDAADWVGDKAAEAADWAYYQVGKVFDVRVDPPECTGKEPDWVSETNFIATARNNPILFCTGRDEKLPDLVVVKARVNRGFAFQIDAPGPHAWTYNSSYKQSDLDQAWKAITDLGDTFADAFTQLVSPDGVIAPGAEYSFGMTEAAARDLTAFRALELAPPNASGFLLSMLGQLVGAEVNLLVDGYAAAAIGTATCADRFANARDGTEWAAAVAECLWSFDETVAETLALYFLKRGMSSNTAGQLAGRIIGKITVYLALIGPVFNTINYTLERNTTKEARTVRIHPTVTREPAKDPPIGAPPDVDDLVLSFSGLGPVKLGASVAAAERTGMVSWNPTHCPADLFGSDYGALETSDRYRPLTGPNPVGLDGFPSFAVDVDLGSEEVRWIEVYDPAIATTEGIRVGDTVATLEQAYGAELSYGDDNYVGQESYVRWLRRGEVDMVFDILSGTEGVAEGPLPRIWSIGVLGARSEHRSNYRTDSVPGSC